MKNLKISTRLLLLVVTLCGMLAAGAALGLWSLSAANASLHTVYEDRAKPLASLGEISRLLLEVRLDANAAFVNHSPARSAELAGGMEQNIAKVNKLWDGYMATYLTAEEQRLAKDFAAVRQQYLDTGVRPAIAAMRADDLPTLERVIGTGMRAVYPDLVKGVNALIELQERVAQAESDRADAQYRTVRGLVAVGMTLSLLFAGLLGWTMVRGISRDLRRAVAACDAVANGDLQNPVVAEGRDEISELLRALAHMQSSLVTIVAGVRQGTDAISTASSQIAAGNQDLSQRTEEQASSLEETAASMEQLTGTVKQNAENARHANQLARSASDVAAEGGVAVGQVVDTMASINDSSRKIVEITSVIDGIAFQTNILALNAAVEAARAGEQGRGFAVVAAEVRSLAQRSAAAAKEIKALIDDSVGKVGAGSEQVALAGERMGQIVSSIQRVTDIMGEISAASEEQTRGIEQVNQAITQMDHVTQQNAALVEEASAAAQSMRQQADHLVDAVRVFKLAGGTRPVVATQQRVVPAKAPSAVRPQRPRLAPTRKPALAAAPQRPQPRLVASGAGADDWAEF